MTLREKSLYVEGPSLLEGEGTGRQIKKKKTNMYFSRLFDCTCHVYSGWYTTVKENWALSVVPDGASHGWCNKKLQYVKGQVLIWSFHFWAKHGYPLDLKLILSLWPLWTCQMLHWETTPDPWDPVRITWSWTGVGDVLAALWPRGELNTTVGIFYISTKTAFPL